MYRISEYITHVVVQAVKRGLNNAIDYWGISGIKHKFIKRSDDILRFNNQSLMRRMVKDREREKQAVNALSLDEYGLRQLFKVDEERKYDPMMGVLLTDENMKYLWRVFEESNYTKRKICVKTSDILQHSFNVEDDAVHPKKDGVQGLIHILCKEDKLFPSHADLHFIPHRTWEYNRTTDIILAKLQCKQPGCDLTLSASFKMGDLQEYRDGFTEVLCVFGGGHCIHVEGKLRTHNKEFQKENGTPINVENPGKSVSYIRTYAKQLKQADGASLIAGTSYAPNWSQTKYAVEQKMDCRVMSGSDVKQNVKDLQKASIHSEIERLKIPPIPKATDFFGFIHDVRWDPSFNADLYDPVQSHILVEHSPNLTFDTTGGLCGDIKDINGTKRSVYNFIMSVPAPQGGVQAVPVFENINCSKDTHTMFLALTRYGSSFNKWKGRMPGRPVWEGYKYGHMDTDKATSNAISLWANGIGFREYNVRIWRDWEQRIYDEFDETWKIILKWCWPHVTGYLVKYDDPYKHVDKKYHFMFKQLVLHFFRLFKLSLHYPVLMTCINELYCVLNTEYFEYGSSIPGNLIGLDDIVTALDNDDVYADIEGILEQSKAKAMAAAEVDRLLKAMHEIETQDEKDGAESCDWTTHDDQLQINVHFKGSVARQYITCDISNFKIPVEDMDKGKRNLLYCPALWDYLFKTIVFIPCISAMSTGGTDKETNMQAEGVNRHFKHVEGMRNMRIDRYLSQRSIVQFEMTIYFCIRIREKNAKSMIKGSLLQDMWSGKGHVKSADSALDLCAIQLFSKLLDFENTMDSSMGYKRLHTATMCLLKETGFADVYGFDALSFNLFYKLKWHKAIDYKSEIYVRRLCYFILWMIHRLKTRHKSEIGASYEQYPQLNQLNIFDFKVNDADADDQDMN
eukprot:190302_1